MLSSSFQDVLNLFERETDYNSVASICKLSRLDYPYIIETILLSLFLSLVKPLQELRVLFVVDAFLDVERERKEIEHFLSN